ncbi:hypothetical protein [Absidia glauca]|uniref:Uncharacterized protein n=1 Tax=Absidia glauca TaxID=4829 RepID=A0A163JG68_ABSGL|nr:hypothetical protein [Absidia glauca]
MIEWDDNGYRLSGTRTGRTCRPSQSFQVHSHSIVDSVAFALLSTTARLPTTICTLPLTRFAPPVSSSSFILLGMTLG